MDSFLLLASGLVLAGLALRALPGLLMGENPGVDHWWLRYYIETYRLNHKCDPPAISLNQKQRNMLSKSAQLAGSELSKFTRHGISFHWVEESPEAGRPKNTPQI